MKQSLPGISIGEAPHYLMRDSKIELFHSASFKFIRQTERAHVDGASDRSLIQMVKILKQKLTAYGWHEGAIITWHLIEDIQGSFNVNSSVTTIDYHLPRDLTDYQRQFLLQRIEAHFPPNFWKRPNSEIAKP
jgi:hypothetical protein